MVSGSCLCLRDLPGNGRSPGGLEKIGRISYNIIVLTSFYSVLEHGVATAPNYRRRICEFSHFRLLVLVHREDAHSHMGKKGNTSVKTQVSSIVWTNKHRGSIPRFPTKVRKCRDNNKPLQPRKPHGNAPRRNLAGPCCSRGLGTLFGEDYPD